MNPTKLRYTGKTVDPSKPYLPSEELKEAVNLALYLGRPLLLKGEPGCGKTAVAAAVARELGMELYPWPVKSSSRARDGLYVFDGIRRLHDAQLAAARGPGQPVEIKAESYIRKGPLGLAFESERQAAVLIDEIDKADIDFPNDLLNELDEAYFVIEETGARVEARHRPLVFITSNDEKDLPDALLRRCVFHYIEFPGEARLGEILAAHFPELEVEVARKVVERFTALRQSARDKKPSTSELLDWVRVLQQHGRDEVLRLLDGKLPYRSVLLKSWHDHLRAQEALAPGGTSGAP